MPTRGKKESIKNLTVRELEKYLNHHSLCIKGNKKDKIKAITCDVLRKEQKNNASTAKIARHLETIHESDNESSDPELESDDDHDVIVQEIGSSSEEEDVVNEGQFTVTTRSGRRAGTWKHAMFH